MPERSARAKTLTQAKRQGLLSGSCSICGEPVLMNEGILHHSLWRVFRATHRGTCTETAERLALRALLDYRRRAARIEKVEAARRLLNEQEG